MISEEVINHLINNFALLKSQKIMGFLDSLKGIVYRFDLFATGSLLRIKGDSEYKTIVGGVVSISLMILLAIVFWNKIVATIDKLMITSATTTTNANDPLPYNFVTTDGNFMMGVEIWNLDLNGPQRYFDIVLSNTKYIYGSFDSLDYYDLEPCTIDHWAGYPQIQAKYTQIHMDRWLCLPKNKSFQIKGKYSSPQSKTLDLIVSKCSSSSSDPRPCAAQADIDQFFADNQGVLYYIVYFINPIINPDSENYLDYYLEDSNYITFSPNGGEESRIFVQDYQIETDQSIFPNTDIITETGGIVTGNGIKSSYFQVVNTYAMFLFFKSTSSRSYTRSFEKLDNVFSYIGGLFGIILIAFFSVVEYNTFKYELTLARCLYKKDEELKPQEKKYGFFTYLREMLYSFLNMIRIHPNWAKFKYFQAMKEEMNKQLDILLLLKRINFLEISLSYLFTDHQIVGLHLANKLTLEQAIRIRRRYRLKGKLKDQIEEANRKQNQNQRQQNGINESIFRDNESNNQQGSKEVNFKEQNYSSEQQSDEDEETHVLDAVKKIQQQQNQNQISKRIWRSIETQFAINPSTTNRERAHQIYQSQFQDINIQNYYNRQHPSNNNNFSAKVQQFHSEQNIKDQANLFANRARFSKLKAVHTEKQNQFYQIQ